MDRAFFLDVLFLIRGFWYWAYSSLEFKFIWDTLGRVFKIYAPTIAKLLYELSECLLLFLETGTGTTFSKEFCWFNNSGDFRIPSDTYFIRLCLLCLSYSNGLCYSWLSNFFTSSLTSFCSSSNWTGFTGAWFLGVGGFYLRFTCYYSSSFSSSSYIGCISSLLDRCDDSEVPCLIIDPSPPLLFLEAFFFFLPLMMVYSRVDESP